MIHPEINQRVTKSQPEFVDAAWLAALANIGEGKRYSLFALAQWGDAMIDPGAAQKNKCPGDGLKRALDWLLARLISACLNLEATCAVVYQSNNGGEGFARRKAALVVVPIHPVAGFGIGIEC